MVHLKIILSFLAGLLFCGLNVFLYDRTIDAGGFLIYAILYGYPVFLLQLVIFVGIENQTRPGTAIRKFFSANIIRLLLLLDGILMLLASFTQKLSRDTNWTLAILMSYLLAMMLFYLMSRKSTAAE